MFVSTNSSVSLYQDKGLRKGLFQSKTVFRDTGKGHTQCKRLLQFKMASRRLPTCCFFQNKLNKKVFIPRDHCHRLLLSNSQDPQANPQCGEVLVSPIWKPLLRSHWCPYQAQFHALSPKKSALLKREWDMQTPWEIRPPFCLFFLTQKDCASHFLIGLCPLGQRNNGKRPDVYFLAIKHNTHKKEIQIHAHRR